MQALRSLAGWIDRLNEYVGRGVAWVALIMVVVQFVVVILRYVFSMGSIPLQESIWYAHGILFMVGAGYTYLHDGHVRVDIIYRSARPKKKAVIDIFGVVAFLLPVCTLTWWVSWGYVLNSWRTMEGSMETSGLPFIYLLKTVILVFVVLIALQGVSVLIKSAFVLAEAQPAREQEGAQ